jgi:hypothetical protein
MRKFTRRLGFTTCGSKFVETRSLFIGILVPCRREQGVPPVLFISGLQIATYSEKSKRGRILTWGIGARVRVRVNPLTRVGSGRARQLTYARTLCHVGGGGDWAAVGCCQASPNGCMRWEKGKKTRLHGRMEKEKGERREEWVRKRKWEEEG